MGVGLCWHVGAAVADRLLLTKTDIATPEQVSIAGDYLRLAGVTETLSVSALTGDGMAALTERLA